MKKIIVLLLSAVLLFILSACGEEKEPVNSTKTAEETEETQNKDADVTKEVTETEMPQVTEEIKETEQVQENEAVQKAETALKESKAVSENADVANAVKMEDTSAESPVPINQWMQLTNYATEDKLYHTVYARITKVTTQTEDDAYIQECITTHNSLASDFSQLRMEDMKIPADAELCVVDYEISIPEDFPSPEYGLASPKLTFAAGNADGGGIPSPDGTSTYIGMGTCENLETEEVTYLPGNTYKFRSAYVMVKDFEDYVFKGNTYQAGGEGDVETMVYFFFSSKEN